MELQIALITSALLQLIAFIITISLIPKTKFSIAWISISTGFLLMAIRRGIDVFLYINSDPVSSITLANSWIAVVISIAMLVASIYIRKIFRVINRLDSLRKENEARLLSSIISTEEKERKTFAKELHDGLGPILSSAKMTLSVVDKENATSSNTVLIGKIEHLIDNAIEATKEISNNLTPHILDRFGLKKAIEHFVRNVVADNVDINISINIGKQRYDYKVEVILYRICCELINNTLKYAKAHRVSVLITESNGFVELKYDDDGVGFNVEKEEVKGMGLTNVKSRVKSLNGEIELLASPNRGFYAQIKLPV